MEKSKKRVVIIGAGPAGLTAAWELCRRSDTEVIVIEQDNTVGGISRTVRYKGNCMDLGGHRYFSKSDTVTKWWQELMPMADEAAQNAVDNNDVMLLRNRLSRIYFLRRFFDYPISLSWQTMRNLGLRRLVRIGLSYVRIRLFPIREERSLEDFYINRFGRELYETFFRDYTQKLWGVECSAISPEWGNQRVKGLSIGAALAHMARRIVRHTDPKKVQTSLIDRFLYPKFGSGHIWEVAAKRISKAGGKILLDSRVTTIHVEQNRVLDITIIDKQGCERQIKCDWLISSMPVRELIAAIDGLVPSEVQKVADGFNLSGFHDGRITPRTYEDHGTEREILSARHLDLHSGTGCKSRTHSSVQQLESLHDSRPQQGLDWCRIFCQRKRRVLDDVRQEFHCYGCK